MAHYIVDRFESTDWAVLEDDRARTFSIPRLWLPAEAREGDVLNISEQPATGIRLLRFELDLEARHKQLTEATRLRDQLPRGPKGDVSL